MANHRYVLRRSWLGDEGVVNFIMLNPSTADDVFDDAERIVDEAHKIMMETVNRLAPAPIIVTRESDQVKP